MPYFNKLCYNRQGDVISLTEWGELQNDKDYVRVARTYLNNDVFVSTVWLGVDHSFMNLDTPIIFETMVFGGKYDDYTKRYSTEQEALEGHKTVVDIVCGKIQP